MFKKCMIKHIYKQGDKLNCCNYIHLFLCFLVYFIAASNLEYYKNS